MKRLNPDTGLPFKTGYIRQDNRVFWGYVSRRINKQGYFYEAWITQEAFQRNLINKKKYQLTSPCRSKEYRKKYSDRYKETQKNHYDKVKILPFKRASLLFSSAKQRCKTTGGTITITKEWILQKIENGYCDVTGLQFDMNTSNEFRVNPYSPSLDRINSKDKNYSPENTRVVLTAVNLALGEYGTDVMKPIIKKLIEH